MSHRVGLRLKFRSRQPIHLLQRHSSNQVRLSVCTVIRVCRRGSVLVNHLSSHPIEQCHEAGWTLECNSSISILQELAQLHVFFFFIYLPYMEFRFVTKAYFKKLKQFHSNICQDVLFDFVFHSLSREDWRRLRWPTKTWRTKVWLWSGHCEERLVRSDLLFLYIFKELGVYCSISLDICDGKKAYFGSIKSF